jgi:hypothetical protein
VGHGGRAAELAYHPCLTVHVLWRPGSQGGSVQPELLARHLYSRLTRDAERSLSRGIGIPVLFWDSWEAARHPVHGLKLEGARRTAVVALVDAGLVLDVGWRRYLEGLWRQMEDVQQPHRLFPVALSEAAYRLPISEANYIRLYEPRDFAQKAQVLARSLTHELCRQLLSLRRVERDTTPLSPAPVKLFISHAKYDGLALAQRIRDHVHRHGPLQTFFDANDIAPGARFAQEIQAHIESSALIVIQTDAYASREWCRREVLIAKRHGRPVVVVNAVRDGEERSFPYLGNVPTLRWNPGDDEAERCEAVIALALREVLRDVHFRQHIEELRGALGFPRDVQVLPRPPELSTLLVGRHEGSHGPRTLLYPDPPMGDAELELMTEGAPQARLVTPTLLAGQAAGSSGQPVLRGWTIGLSISESPDLPRFGLATAHLVDAMVEFARYLLASGATLAYGGDLRAGGFTEVLLELVRNHGKAGEEARVHSFLAWPDYRALDLEAEAKYLPEVCFHRIAPPADLGIAEERVLDSSREEDRLLRARCLSAMRRELHGRTQARIVLGGRLTEYAGQYPGLVEEALLALEGGVPLFVLGGLGGCGRALAQALQGTEAEEGERLIASEEVWETLRSKGVSSLRNGLSDAENARLFETRHLPEMISLVLKGLTRLATGPAEAGTPPYR